MSFLFRLAVVEHRDIPFRKGAGVELEGGTAVKLSDGTLRPMFTSRLPSATGLRQTAVGHLVDGAAGHIRDVVSGVHEPGIPTGIPVRYRAESVP